MALTKDQIVEKLRDNADRLLDFGVRRLSLFGSAARDERRENSDLDFVVDFEQKSFDAYMDLKFFLEDLFGCQVDLVVSETIKPRLRSIIEAEMVDAAGL